MMEYNMTNEKGCILESIWKTGFLLRGMQVDCCWKSKKEREREHRFWQQPGVEGGRGT